MIQKPASTVQIQIQKATIAEGSKLDNTLIVIIASSGGTTSSGDQMKPGCGLFAEKFVCTW